MILSSLAQSTKQQYDSQFRHWIAFCEQRDHDPFVASEEAFCFYAAWSFSEGRKHPLTFKSFKSYLNGIRQCLNILGVAFPAFSRMPLLERVSRGYKRMSSAPGQKARLPITTSILRRIWTVLDHRQHDDRVFWAMASSGVLGLFRMGELTPMSSDPERFPRIQDLKVYSNDHAGIVLDASKGDPFRLGVTVHLVATGNVVCAVRALTNMLAGRADRAPDAPLFALANGRPVTRDWFITRMRAGLKLIGEDDTAYNGHSLRKGGAQSLYDAGVPDGEIRVLGRWHSWAFRLYFKLSLEAIKSHLYKMARAKPAKLLLDYSTF